MRGLFWVWLFLTVAEASGQGAQIPAATAATLLSLGGRAAVIFSGRVVEVSRNEEDGFVDVMFHVERAVRGCSDGSSYTLREWAGLWIGNPERYAAGQRLLILLPARGSSGMSAPVGGMAGVIPVLAGRRPPLIHGRIPAPGTIATEDESVDLRWVQTLSVRKLAKASSTASEPEMQIAPWPGPIERLPYLPQLPASGPSLNAVLALLGRGSGH